MDDLAKALETGLKTGRDFDRGRKLFASAKCFACHRYDNEGCAQGPDLTGISGRFNVRDLLESIVEPSKEVSDQYAAVVITLKNGKEITGRIVNETKDALTILLDPEDSTKVVEVKKSKVEELKPSLVSVMPQGALKTLNENELLDLLAYLLSRGDPRHPMFRK